MKQFFREKPLHSFLIGIYIVSVVYAQNLHKVNISSTYRSFAVAFIVSVLVYGFVYLFYRSARKAGIFTTSFIIGLFLYGLIYEQIETFYYRGHWPLFHIHRYLIGVYLLIYGSLFILFYRSKLPHYNLTFILNCFVSFILLFNIISAIQSSSSTRTALTNPFLSDSIFRTAAPRQDQHPDVYYIILDGFASERILKQHYGRSNDYLYQYLRQKGFYIADSSSANYPTTVESLSSSMNLNYLDTLGKADHYGMIQKSLLTHIFKKQGYQIQNIESGYAVTNHFELSDKTVKLPSFNEFENKLLDLTILRLDDLLGMRYYNRLEFQFKRVDQLTGGVTPKFNFVHIVGPHPPYVVDSSGKRNIDVSVSDLAWEPKSQYVNQLIYISKKISQFIDTVLAASALPPVIIIQSDHGPWLSDSKENVYDSRVSILNAYFVPDSMKSKLYPHISPVNSFRLFFAEQFNMPFQLLPDTPFPYIELQKNLVFQEYSK